MEVRSGDALIGPSNFKWSAKPGCDPHSVTYIEHGSKNRQGGLSDMRVENKEVAVSEEDTTYA